MKYRVQSIVAGCLLFACTSVPARAQAAEVLNNRGEPIPERYKSWALFLISNPEWLLPESATKLQELYWAFKAFGRAIGPDHAAVWFWSEEPRDGDFARAVDVMRSSAFCQRLKLPPSRGPYVLVTTEYPGSGLLNSYPDTFPEGLKNFQVLELNGSSASESMRVLNKLADQLVARNLDELNPASEDYWRRWQKSYLAIRDTVVVLSEKVTLKIKTSFFEVDIAF